MVDLTLNYLSVCIYWYSWIKLWCTL